MANRQKISPLTPTARDELEMRGIPPEMAEQHGVVSVTSGNGEAFGFRHHVNGGDQDHWAFRGVGQKKFWQSSGTKRSLWNNQAIFDDRYSAQPLIITEGHIDALSIMAAGFGRVVSVPDGAPSAPSEDPKTKYDSMAGIDWKLIKDVVLAVDSDAPGQALRSDLCRVIGAGRCRFVEWPADCKDANDVLMKYGQDVLVSSLMGSKWVEISGLREIGDIPPEPDENPWQSGIAGVDDLWRPVEGRMTVLTGIPGHGKTQFWADAVCRLVTKNNIVAALASFEDSVMATLVPRLRQWFLGKDQKYASDEEFARSTNFIERHFVFICADREEEPTVEWFNEMAEAAAGRFNAKIVVLDPWNEIDHTKRPSDVPITEYTGVMLKRLRTSAKVNRYHLIVAAHPTKLTKGTDGKTILPTGYNIADSANFVNKPDNGITVYRETDNSVRFVSWKAKRDGVIGTLGKRTLRFNTQTGRYDLDEFADYGDMQ